MYLNKIDYSLPYASFWKFFDWNMEIVEVSRGGWIQFRDYAGNEWITCEEEEEPDELPAPVLYRNETAMDIDEHYDNVVDRLFQEAGDFLN